MNKLKSKQWWEAAGTRAIKTMVQTALPLIPAGVVVWDVDWVMILGVIVTTGILSLATSLGGLPEVEEE